MRIIDVYGFGDTGILLTQGLNELGADCDMLVSNRQFAGHLPSWTKRYKHITKEKVFIHKSEDTRDPDNIIDFVKFVNTYDMAIFHRPGDMYADMIKIPFCIWDGGSSRFTFPPSKVKNPPVEADKAAARRAVKHAKVLFASDIDLLYKLFIPKKYKNAVFMPLPVDTDLFRPRRTRRSKKFTIYLPARQENAIKGTLDMLKGISLFLQQKNYIDPDNVLVKIPLFGMDSVMIPRTLKDLGLEDITELVPLLPKKEFAQAINKSDVIIDQLRLGAYGGVAIQAMSCAKTVIVNAHKPWYQEQLNDVPPILYAKTDYDVCAQLLHAYDFYERKYFKMAESAREYAVRHHDYRKVSRKVLDCMEE